jgi:hypothetical protein
VVFPDDRGLKFVRRQDLDRVFSIIRWAHIRYLIIHLTPRPLMSKTVQLNLTNDQVRLTDKQGLDLNGSQDKAYVPRSRKNYTRFELKAGPTLLVEQAMLDGGYELKDGGRGGYVQSETYDDGRYTQADYLCQQK